MDRVQHLWNVVNHLSFNLGPEVTSLQSFYVERCRDMGNSVELPKNIFGSGAMCSYCGSLWSRVDHRVRFLPGKKPAKSVRKILKNEKKIGRVKATLVKRAIKNSGNKATIRCSFCSKLTVINMVKSDRQKPTSQSKTVDSTENQTPAIKKRKRRTKDRTAGLIITPNNKLQDLSKTPKAKSTNLNKLGAMIKKNLTPAKKSSLHDFIIDLGS